MILLGWERRLHDPKKTWMLFWCCLPLADDTHVADPLSVTGLFLIQGLFELTIGLTLLVKEDWSFISQHSDLALQQARWKDM